MTEDQKAEVETAQIRNLLGPGYTAEDLKSDVESLDVAERAITDHIGILFVDQQDGQAERVREGLFALQRITAVAARVAVEGGAE